MNTEKEYILKIFKQLNPKKTLKAIFKNKKDLKFAEEWIILNSMENNGFPGPRECHWFFKSNTNMYEFAEWDDKPHLDIKENNRNQIIRVMKDNYVDAEYYGLEILTQILNN